MSRSDSDQRPATVADVHKICAALPGVTFGESWGDVPTYLVENKPKPKGFVLFRKPHHSAIDPTTSEPFPDLLVIRVADAGQKAALLADDRAPFFDIDHFRRYNAVLLQQSRLGELTVGDLRTVLWDAWASQAPQRLIDEFDRAQTLQDPS